MYDSFFVGRFDGVDNLVCDLDSLLYRQRG